MPLGHRDGRLDRLLLPGTGGRGGRLVERGNTFTEGRSDERIHSEINNQQEEVKKRKNNGVSDGEKVVRRLCKERKAPEKRKKNWDQKRQQREEVSEKWKKGKISREGAS